MSDRVNKKSQFFEALIRFMGDNSQDFDVVIIGGGPGGLSAAMWCADLGLKAVVLEKESEFGGQLLWTFNPIKNYLGIEVITGRELRDRFCQHIGSRQITRRTGVAIENVNLKEKTVSLTDGTTFVGKAMIIATGVRRRVLGVSGEERFAGRGILDSGARNYDAVREKTVVIVGGGDAALENALILSETAKKIIVIHRREEFSARKEFVERAMDHPAITFVFDTIVTAIIGNTAVEKIELRSATSGKTSSILSDAVLIRIGVVPNTELFCGQLSLTGTGYVITDAFCSTNIAGVYAIGDVVNQLAPTINNAVGQGSAAAKSAVAWLSSNVVKR